MAKFKVGDEVVRVKQVEQFERQLGSYLPEVLRVADLSAQGELLLEGLETWGRWTPDNFELAGVEPEECGPGCAGCEDEEDEDEEIRALIKEALGPEPPEPAQLGYSEQYVLGLLQPAPLSEASPAQRKEYPIFSGVLAYFPDAIAEVARVSKIGNDQHNPGEPLHWARGKSMDQEDCLVRHLLERGTIDKDGVRHSAKVAWRALAMLQLELEAAKDDQ